VTDEPEASEPQAASPEVAAPKKNGALRWLVLTPLALFLVVAGVSFSQLTGPKPQPASFTSPTRPVPKMSTPTLDGQSIDFASLKGPVIVNFWATWCAPCKAEHPILMQMKAKGVPIIGVQHFDESDRANPDVATGKARAMLQQAGNPFQTLAVDPSGDVSLTFGIAGVPESFLVDSKGLIVKTTRGPLIGADADAMYDAYKAEVAKATKAS
jgi:cytochrome c biogenesis protein CcmG/thiol:disulfide interchange protein DsbE